MTLTSDQSLLIDLTIVGPGNFSCTVTALRIGPFGIFHGGQGWNVTHIASGLACWKECCCVLHAVAVAEAITDKIDWSLADFDALNKAGAAAGLRKIISQVACPSPEQHGGVKD